MRKAMAAAVLMVLGGMLLGGTVFRDQGTRRLRSPAAVSDCRRPPGRTPSSDLP